jgi:WD40 repeat protein
MDVLQIINTNVGKKTLLPTPVVGLIYDYYNKPITITSAHGIGNIIISRDCKTIAYSRDNSIIEIWDIDSGNKINEFTCDGGIHKMAFLSDGKKIIINCINGAMQIWDISGALLKKYDDDVIAYGTFAVSLDGETIIFATETGMIQIFDVKTGYSSVINSNNSYFGAVAMTPDGETIATMVDTASDHYLQIINAKTNDFICKLDPGDSDLSYSMAFSADGTKFIGIFEKKIIKIWDVKNNYRLIHDSQFFHNDGDTIELVRISPSGAQLLTILASGIINIWDIETMKRIKIIDSGNTSVKDIIYSPCGNRIVGIFGDNKKILIWQI